jgi:hypothetical protein
MAWSNSTINGRSVITETLTVSGTSANTSSTSTYITSRKPFTVAVNTANTNTDAGVTAELQGSFDESAWQTLTSGLIGNIDSAGKAAVYAPDSHGNYPYYRVLLTAAGTLTTDSITVKIVY